MPRNQWKNISPLQLMSYMLDSKTICYIYPVPRLHVRSIKKILLFHDYLSFWGEIRKGWDIRLVSHSFRKYMNKDICFKILRKIKKTWLGNYEFFYFMNVRYNVPLTKQTNSRSKIGGNVQFYRLNDFYLIKQYINERLFSKLIIHIASSLATWKWKKIKG